MHSAERYFNKQTTSPKLLSVAYCYIAFLISACGGSKSEDKNNDYFIGFSQDYIPPNSNYNEPHLVDPYFKAQEPDYNDPYWVNSLIMEYGEETVDHLLSLDDRTFFFSFPSNEPTYVPITILGWAPANNNITNASREIFGILEQVLDTTFVEADTVEGVNVIAISQSIQPTTAGYSYFPNTFYELGSDVFISKEYSNPIFLKNELTNYDYETLVHEIGHALGLKHPFESSGSNLAVLDAFEDQTKYTAMSYDDYSYTFDGTFRALDWMALTKLYGVNSAYRASDNTYNFSQTEGVFIIDGAGTDTIDCETSVLDVFIDLRPGTHSHEGSKNDFITSARQLTISHGSDIENVETGAGDDVVIGNDLQNTVHTGLGDDTIFGGEGMDIIHPGLGINIIDLSEENASTDSLVLEISNSNSFYNYVYGFEQGEFGDTVELLNFNLESFQILPLVDSMNVPSGYIDNCLVRITGENLDSNNVLEQHFNDGGVLQTLNLSENNSALLITAESQDTGANQNLYVLNNIAGYNSITSVSQFLGNYLDIDNWSITNFIL